MLLVIAWKKYVGATSVFDCVYGKSGIVHELYTLDQFTAFLSV